MTWRALLQGQEAKDALKTARELMEAVRSCSLEEAGPTEAAFRALAFKTFDEAFPQEGYLDAAEEAFEFATGSPTLGSLQPFLYDGLVGIAWVARHLGSDMDEELVLQLTELVQLSPWPARYDLISGLVGIGLYALKVEGPAGAELLARVVVALDQCSTQSEHGCAWHSARLLLPDYQRQTLPHGKYDTGTAHGAAGVLAVVSAALRRGVEIERARKLALGASHWLSDIAADSCASAFPAWLGGTRDALPARPTNPSYNARCAWCYGDAGIAVQMWAAGEALNDPDSKLRALQILTRSASLSAEQAMIVDAGLCHGSAGLAHLFNRVAFASGSTELAAAARKWFQHTLASRSDQGVGGYPMIAPSGLAVSDATFLTGSTGVSLALLAASSTAAPKWDGLLGMGW